VSTKIYVRKKKNFLNNILLQDGDLAKSTFNFKCDADA